MLTPTLLVPTPIHNCFLSFLSFTLPRICFCNWRPYRLFSDVLCEKISHKVSPPFSLDGCLMFQTIFQHSYFKPQILKLDTAIRRNLLLDSLSMAALVVFTKPVASMMKYPYPSILWPITWMSEIHHFLSKEFQEGCSHISLACFPSCYMHILVLVHQ